MGLYEGETSLYFMIAQGDIDTVDWLIKEGARCISSLIFWILFNRLFRWLIAWHHRKFKITIFSHIPSKNSCCDNEFASRRVSFCIYNGIRALFVTSMLCIWTDLIKNLMDCFFVPGLCKKFSFQMFFRSSDSLHPTCLSSFESIVFEFVL